jgi:hypothetical protein
VLDESKILKLAQDELAASTSVETSSEEALAYFNCEKPAAPVAEENEAPWSDMVSPDVRNAVLATMAEIIPGFTSDVPAEFQPTSADDEAQASEESKIVTHVIFDACGGYELLLRAIQDLLLKRIGVLQVYWDNRKVVTGQRIDAMPAEQVMLLQQQGADIVNAVDLGDGTYQVDLRETVRRNEPRVEWVPAAELRVGEDQQLSKLDEALFVARRRLVPASDLVAIGIDKDLVDELSAASGDTNTADDSVRMIVINECYMRIDADGDGIAESRRVVLGGGARGDDRLLDERPWGVQPFALGVAYFAPDSWEGISLYDRIKFVQDIKTELARQIIETGWRNLIQRLWAMERLYNSDDLRASRRGGVVRVKDPNAIGALPDVQINPVSMSLLEMVDKMRREAGGGAIDTAPQVQEMGGDTAHGLERLMSAIEQTNAMVAKTIAETLVSQLYLKVHQLLRTHWQDVIRVRAGKSWLQQTPKDWQARSDVAVSVGLSVGDRAKQAASLASVIGQQTQAMSSGQDGVLVGLPQMHNALVDYARMIGLNAPEQYWVDPASPEGQQAAQGKAQAQQQAQQQAAAAAQAQLDTMERLENIKADARRYSDDLAHVQSVNDALIKLLEASGKYTSQDVADFEVFRRAMQVGQPSPDKLLDVMVPKTPSNGGG